MSNRSYLMRLVKYLTMACNNNPVKSYVLLIASCAQAYTNLLNY